MQIEFRFCSFPGSQRLHKIVSKIFIFKLLKKITCLTTILLESEICISNRTSKLGNFLLPSIKLVKIDWKYWVSLALMQRILDLRQSHQYHVNSYTGRFDYCCFAYNDSPTMSICLCQFAYYHCYPNLSKLNLTT